MERVDVSDEEADVFARSIELFDQNLGINARGELRLGGAPLLR